MPEFSPSQSVVAIATLPVKPAGLQCEAELYLGEGKATTSGRVPFISTGKNQTIQFSITMPDSGTYQALLDIFTGSIQIGAFYGTEEITIAAPPPPPPPPLPPVCSMNGWYAEDLIHRFAVGPSGTIVEDPVYSFHFSVNCNIPNFAVSVFGAVTPGYPGGNAAAMLPQYGRLGANLQPIGSDVVYNRGILAGYWTLHFFVNPDPSAAYWQDAYWSNNAQEQYSGSVAIAIERGWVEVGVFPPAPD